MLPVLFPSNTGEMFRSNDVQLTVLVLTICALHIVNSCDIMEKGVSDDEIKIILQEHNNIRAEISQGKLEGQPKGKGFKEIKYDKKLAKEAQRIADECEFAHKNVDDDRWAVGQNLFQSMQSNLEKGADWKKGIKSWTDEHKLYNFGDPFNTETGHYTQVVWADTEYVGCGYTMYETNGSMKYNKFYVCNYGPAGNYEGENPYEPA